MTKVAIAFFVSSNLNKSEIKNIPIEDVERGYSEDFRECIDYVNTCCAFIFDSAYVANAVEGFVGQLLLCPVVQLPKALDGLTNRALINYCAHIKLPPSGP